jgi:hypothetical protein
MATFMHGWLHLISYTHSTRVEELSLLILLPTHIFYSNLLEYQTKNKKDTSDIHMEIAYPFFSKSFLLFLSHTTTKPLYTYNFFACKHSTSL